jgi:alkaline phosphatase
VKDDRTITHAAHWADGPEKTALYTPGVPSPLNTGHVISRRSFLGASAGLGAAAIGGGWSVARASTGRAAPVRGAAGAGQPKARARNIIFLVADGFSAGALGLLEQYLRVTDRGPSQWRRITSGPGVRMALQSTYSANSVVTDSAAASTAWSVGAKCNNGALCVLPDNSRPEPLLLRAKRSGKRIGCVTTTTITHATPAGFYANVPVRGNQSMVGEQLVHRPVDLALGGGARYVDEALAGADGIRVVRTAAELGALTGDGPSRLQRGERVIGLFNREHVNMHLDRTEQEPGLEAMSRFAVEMLGRDSDEGFVLQVEAGRVDHAAHRNDAAGLLGDMIEFDRTLGFLAEWTRSRDDTLLVVISDHGCGAPSLTMYGRDGIRGLRRLGDVRHSFEWILEQLGKPETPEAGAATLARLVAEVFSVDLKPEELEFLRRALAGQPVELFTKRHELTSLLGVMLGNRSGVGFVTSDHTGEMTDTLALGAGSETMPAYIDNAGVVAWLTELAALAR